MNIPSVFGVNMSSKCKRCDCRDGSWYQMGEFIGVDFDDARYLLERKFWRKEE